MPDTFPLPAIPDETAALPQSLTAKDLRIDPLLLAARQAAALCSVSTATWWRWDTAARIPAPVRLSPGCVRWAREVLTAWIQWGCPDRKRFEAMQASRNSKR